MNTSTGTSMFLLIVSSSLSLSPSSLYVSVFIRVRGKRGPCSHHLTSVLMWQENISKRGPASFLGGGELKNRKLLFPMSALLSLILSFGIWTEITQFHCLKLCWIAPSHTLKIQHAHSNFLHEMGLSCNQALSHHAVCPTQVHSPKTLPATTARSEVSPPSGQSLVMEAVKRWIIYNKR